MRKILSLILLLSMSFSLAFAQGGRLIGLTGQSLAIISMDPLTGDTTHIGQVPNSGWTSLGVTIDVPGMRYFYAANNDIRILDLVSGTVIDSLEVTLLNFHYNSTDGYIYGLRSDSNSLFDLQRVDPAVGTLEMVNDLNISGVGGQNSAIGFPNKNHFYFPGNSTTYKVELSTGNVVDSLDLGGFTNYEYNYPDNSLYGIGNDSNNIFELRRVDSTGAMTVLGTTGQNMSTNGESAIDPYNGRYFFSSGQGITVMDINTGAILNTFSVPIARYQFCGPCDPLWGLIVVEEIEPLHISVSPNPFTNSTTLKFQNPNNKSHTLTLYNIQGRLIRSIPDITSGEVVIVRGELPSGLYFFELRSEGVIRGKGKLVVGDR